MYLIRKKKEKEKEKRKKTIALFVYRQQYGKLDISYFFPYWQEVLAIFPCGWQLSLKRNPQRWKILLFNSLHFFKMFILPLQNEN